MFDPVHYAFEPYAVPYVLAALLAVSVGGGLLLYERFTPSSLRLFALSVAVAVWLSLFGVVSLSATRWVGVTWFRLALAVIPFTMPLLYQLALQMTGHRRPRVVALAWAGAAVVAATAAGPLYTSLQQLFQGHFPAVSTFIGVFYLLYLAGFGVAVLVTWAAAWRTATSVGERRRHMAMFLATAAASFGVADIFFSRAPVGMAPVAMTVSLAIMAVAGTRFRAFGLSTRFATDEVLRAMGDGVLVCDAAGVVRAANAAARRMLEVRKTDVTGTPIGRWVEDADEVLGGLDGSVRDRQITLRTATGESLEASASIEPIRLATQPVGAVIVARDIRARLNTQRALEAAQRRYSSLFWHNPAVLYEFDMDGRFVALNPAAEALLGRPTAELRGTPVVDVLTREDQEEARRVFKGVAAGESQEYVVTAKTAHGGRRRIRGVSIPIFEGADVVGMFGVALDTTEQERIQHELEVQRRYFADLFNSSPEGIVLLDPGTDQVLRVNEEFTRMFGYTSQEALGRELTDLIVPEDLAKEGPDLNDQAREEGRVRTETVRRRKDGSLIEVSVLARELRIPGEPKQLYGVYRDITARKDAERALKAREDELRHAQRLEAVGKLAGGVAHDFNNLLTVINGHARFALDNAPEDCMARPELEEIERAGTRAAALTQQLLAYSRRQMLRPKVLDPDAVIQELQGMLRRLIGEHIRVETKRAADEVRVRADRGQLEQVLVNLVVNARDAMAEGGVIRLETELVTLAAEDERVDRWDVAPGDYVRIRVADDGRGMDPEVLRHAFEPFFTTKEQGKGTGLGLATVFGIVKQSDGHVVANSQPGRGTTVDVYLPRCTDDRAETVPGEEEVPRERPEGTVLVVEDEAAVRKLAVKALRKEGCTVLSAANGVEALEVVERHEGPLDLVITDLVMPDMGGRELAEELHRRRPDLPVLFMSGYDDAMVGDPGAATDFLAKPFTPAMLAARVAESLSR